MMCSSCTTENHDASSCRYPANCPCQHRKTQASKQAASQVSKQADATAQIVPLDVSSHRPAAGPTSPVTVPDGRERGAVAPDRQRRAEGFTDRTDKQASKHPEKAS